MFSLEFQVRDYECDMQGVVNNAVYQNYLEHARHEYLKGLGIDFAELAEKKISLVVVRAELDYKHSLRSGDCFLVTVRMKKFSPLRFAFSQEVVRQPDGALILAARVIGTALDPQGRPQLPGVLAEALEIVVGSD